jgi:hypothetical protein
MDGARSEAPIHGACLASHGSADIGHLTGLHVVQVRIPCAIARYWPVCISATYLGVDTYRLEGHCPCGRSATSS